MNKLQFVMITIPLLEKSLPALQTLEGKFMPLTTGIEIHKANEYLRTLTKRKIEFKTFKQYKEMINLISEEQKRA